MAILKTSHLKKYYGKEESLVKALDDVNVSVEEGQFVAIIGTSGSGKSTLLNMLGGLDRPTSGSVQVENKSMETMTEEQLTVFRRQRIGFIFQNYNLVPYLTTYENIVLPVRLDGKREDKKFLEEIIHFLELEESSPIIRAIFPADSSSEWQLPELWCLNRPLFWLMSPQEILIPAPVIR